jgi:hypothetical protein
MKSEQQNCASVPSLADQLSRLRKNAELLMSDQIAQLKREYEALYSSQELRLRPSVGSFSLVSCADDAPQRGFSGLKSVAHLKGGLIALQNMPEALKNTGRGTPEKKLQSWLLRSTLSAARELTALPKNAGDRYWLVSDEVALTTQSNENEKRRIVADMLLVKENAEGAAQLVSVELKSLRTMDTFTQVEKFRLLLERDDLKAHWQAFAETMLTRQFRWHEPWASHGVVVWPALRSGVSARESTQRRISAYSGLDVIGYVNGSPYTFQMEQSS